MTTRATSSQRAADSGATGGPGQPQSGKRPWRLLTFSVVAIVLAGAVTATALVISHRRGTAARPSGIPGDVPTSLANLMLLSSLPHQRAPGFTLTDQAGRTMALSRLRGKVVVLEFMDPHCTDICPIVSQEFVDAYHDLGPAAGKVVFAAVNVNARHASVADMAAYSREHGLDSIPSWHFFTGAVPALRAVWRAYHIAVEAPNPNADIIHTSAVYFIDPKGRVAFLASPTDDHTAKGAAFLPATQLSAWGQGIALVARYLTG